MGHGTPLFAVGYDSTHPLGSHLAEQWATSYVSPHAKRRLLTSQQTELAGIEHFVLLDLLGAPHPLIQSYFADTHWLFDALSNVEQRLLDLGLLVSPSADGSPVGETVSFFLPRKVHSYVGHIEDDHLPFIQRGVSVLHVISSPFPRVWHTLKVRHSRAVLSITKILTLVTG
jgi:glutaminyl-peptide cyclotransferase